MSVGTARGAGIGRDPRAAAGNYAIERVADADAARPPARDGSSVFQVRIHGRGGQGVVTAAELLAVAAFDDGRHAQAFPVFGSERTGAPVMAFCRIDEHPIRTREPVMRPDALVIQDPTLLHAVDVFAGFVDGPVLVNTSQDIDTPGRLIKVAASELAREHLGRPMPGAPLLAALAAVTGIVSLAALERAIEERFPLAVARGNIDAARAAYYEVMACA